ncbi:hypothetical protein FKR53_06645, partial [Neisseria meningitidis]|nr:hypothetical protein [Neisseria meningitidis]
VRSVSVISDKFLLLFISRFPLCGNDGGRDKSSQSKASSFPQKTATRNTPSFRAGGKSRSLNFGFFR